MSKTRDTALGMPSQRQLRVGELIRKEISDLLSRGDLNDPALELAVITVPEVRISPDLRNATVLVMPLGGKNAEAVVEALNRSRKYFRGQISRRMTMKYMPELRFSLDTRFDDDDRIGELLHDADVKRDLRTADVATDPDDSTTQTDGRD